MVDGYNLEFISNNTSNEYTVQGSIMLAVPLDVSRTYHEYF